MSISFEPKAYLSLGSNLGERERNIKIAAGLLKSVLDEIEVSSIYETEPLYVTEQPRFLNAVLCGYTDRDPLALLRYLQGIEHDMGRQRNKTVRRGPRIIDLDILLYGERIIRHQDLVIPHPLIRERGFVLIPLLEIDPDLRDPESGEPYIDVLARLDEQGVYTYSDWNYYS